MCTGHTERSNCLVLQIRENKTQALFLVAKTHWEKIYSQEYFAGYQHKPGSQSDFSN